MSLAIKKIQMKTMSNHFTPAKMAMLTNRRVFGELVALTHAGWSVKCCSHCGKGTGISSVFTTGFL